MNDFLPMPDEKGYFGEYGGQVLPPELKAVMDQINDAYDEVSSSDSFKEELDDLYTHYVGRPSPLYFAKRLTKKLGGAKEALERTLKEYKKLKLKKEKEESLQPSPTASPVR